MADMHVMTGDGKSWDVIFHIAVPDANNTVGVNWRTALVNSGLGGTTQLTEGVGPELAQGRISSTEKAQVEAGELIEKRIAFRVEGNGNSLAAVRANLRTRYTRVSAAVLADLQAQLKYFGHTEEES